MSIRATNGSEKLLKLIKGPITNHFPIGCKKIGTPYSSKKLVDIHDYVNINFKNEDKPVVFVIGAFSHGSIEVDYLEETISISNYPLSASVVCGKLCCAFEKIWGIL
jgi:rRNA small subunit pseudouridine methyltransferase Nep1